MTRSAVQWWTALSLLLAAAGALAYALEWPPAQRRGGEGAETAAPQAAAAAESDRWVVASVVGQAEIRAPGGAWQALAPGRAVADGDRLRTGDFSEVILRLGPEGAAVRGETTLALTSNTRFTIGEETPQQSHFTLGLGKVDAELRRRGERSYAFEAEGADAVVDTRSAAFSLVADGDGLMGVATRKGEVGLTSQGQRVVVPAGRQAVAVPGEAPGEPLPIPEEVFLQVKWPDERIASEVVAVAGRTSPGARVRLSGRDVPVSPQGGFEAVVQLAEGPNSLVVLAEDVSGNTRRLVSPPVVREPAEPKALEVRPRGSIWE